MKFPNKTILYNESVISKFPAILNRLSHGEMSASELFLALKPQTDFAGYAADFIDALDCLYALGKINFNPQTRRLSYVI